MSDTLMLLLLLLMMMITLSGHFRLWAPSSGM
jgi:hypothetical protein